MGTPVSKPPPQMDVISGRGSKDHFRFRQYSIYKDFHLGSGTFGDVYKGFDRKRNRLIAAKQIRHAAIQFSQSEVDILRNLTEHDNIVRIYDSFMHRESRFIIMQLCDGPVLQDYMEFEDPPVRIRVGIIFQIVDTLQFMHFATPKTAHRDLKPSNIIIVHGSHVKLCDFGLAKFVDTEKTFNVSTAAGTFKYMSPEIHLGNRYDPFKADVFAAGLVFLAIITFIVGESIDHVFHSVMGVGWDMTNKQDVLQKKLDRLETDCEQTKALISLIARMVKYKPQQRPDFNEIFRIFVRDVQQAPGDQQREDRQTGKPKKPRPPVCVPYPSPPANEPQPGPSDDPKREPTSDEKPESSSSDITLSSDDEPQSTNDQKPGSSEDETPSGGDLKPRPNSVLRPKSGKKKSTGPKKVQWPDNSPSVEKPGPCILQKHAPSSDDVSLSNTSDDDVETRDDQKPEDNKDQKPEPNIDLKPRPRREPRPAVLAKPSSLELLTKRDIWGYTAMNDRGDVVLVNVKFVILFRFRTKNAPKTPERTNSQTADGTDSSKATDSTNTPDSTNSSTTAESTDSSKTPERTNSQTPDGTDSTKTSGSMNSSEISVSTNTPDGTNSPKTTESVNSANSTNSPASTNSLKTSPKTPPKTSSKTPVRYVYHLCMQTPRPLGFQMSCRKAVDSTNSRVLLQTRSETLYYNFQGKLIDKSIQTGYLVGCTGQGEVVYAQRIDDDSSFGLLVQRGGQTLSLEPPVGKELEGEMSVCCLHGQYCVTDYESQFLHIFSRTGEHTQFVKLPYNPVAIAPMTPGYLLIAQRQPPVIHIHAAASGREVGRWAPRDLRVAEGVRVTGVGYEDGVLHLCTRDGDMNTLRAYRVNFKK